jgi:hypothetical protein
VAAIGMSASSLLVTFNALRLSRLAPAPPAGVAREIATEAGNAATP